MLHDHQQATHGDKTRTYNIAAYLRISHDDGLNNESYSIKYQREIIKNYVEAHEDFKTANIVDYVDDGLSGSYTNREGFQRLLYDIGQGLINCVIVKDLSRIGRNMIDVDDLLMNHLVTLNVRFVAINNGYDSFENPLSVLELALINLANQHYNRDLAIKSKTAKNTKAKRGEYLAHPPFGYKKSDTEKNKLVPDDEAAEYVRLIFSLAVEGHRAVEIAQILNRRGIPSPSVYKISKGYKNMWTQVIDPDFCFWTNSVIGRLIRNEVYIGTAISNRYKATGIGNGKIGPRPKNEWIIVPNVHEPLVSESDFQKAQLIFEKSRYSGKPANIFGSKVKCPACKHAMIRYSLQNPRYKCGTANLTDHYDCKKYSISQSEIESIVLESLKIMMKIWFEQEEIEVARIQKNRSSIKELEKTIAAERKAIETLKSSITKIFESFASGEMTKEAFIHKKNVVNDTITYRRSEIDKLDEQVIALKEKCSMAEYAIAELKPTRTIDALNRELVDILIDKIYVHSETEIEIVWNNRFSE